LEKIQPILLNAKELGALLGVGGATIWGYNKSRQNTEAYSSWQVYALAAG